MMPFTGQVVLVTGAGGGIGRALTLGFARQGALVAANDLSPLNLDETLSQVQAAGGQCRGYSYDIAKKMPLQALVSQVLDECGRIDILVNAALVQPNAALLEMDEWDWHRIQDVNLGGPFFAMQTIGRVMQQQGGGVMVNILLPSELLAQRPGFAALTASQAGLAGLTLAAARELAPFHIRVNAVMPVILPEGTPPAPASEASRRTGRVTYQPMENTHSLPLLVEKVLYLCSPAAREVTGQILTPQDAGLLG
jgi:3-oxoacyl-[acyl-carrier protein] reductase